MPAISDQDMNAMLAEESRVCLSVLLTDFSLANIDVLFGQLQQTVSLKLSATSL